MLEHATGIAGSIAGAAEPWAHLYSNSKIVSATVTYLHLVPLIFGAGTAFVLDRATLGASRSGIDRRSAHLLELSRVHRLVVGALAVSFISGLLLFLSDVDTFWPSIFFWIKLALVALLCVNGFVMLRTETALSQSRDDGALWGRMRMLAIISVVLWLATTLAGVVLKEYA